MSSSKLPQPPWSYSVLQSVAAVLADTKDGLTGSEIGDLLARLDMQDPVPGATKRVRLAGYQRIGWLVPRSETKKASQKQSDAERKRAETRLEKIEAEARRLREQIGRAEDA